MTLEIKIQEIMKEIRDLAVSESDRDINDVISSVLIMRLAKLEIKLDAHMELK